MLATLLVTALSIGAFEVALSFMTVSELVSPFEIGVLFAQCTLFMIAAQSMLFLRRFRDRPMKPFIIPTLVTLALGLALMTAVSGIIGHAISTGLVAIGGGLLPPVLAREIALNDGGASGSATGFQSAASHAGQTGGAVFASSIAALSDPDWVFVAVAIAVAVTGIRPQHLQLHPTTF